MLPLYNGWLDETIHHDNMELVTMQEAAFEDLISSIPWSDMLCTLCRPLCTFFEVASGWSEYGLSILSGDPADRHLEQNQRF